MSLIVLTSVVVYSADAAGIPKKAISTVARFLESDLPTTTVFTDHASTYTAGKQTFVASSSSSAGVNIPTGSDPSSPAQGDIWLNSDTLKYFGTSTHSLLTSAITSINSDTTAAQTIQGVSGNTTASTSAGTTTINTGSNVVVTGGSAQTISKQLTINSGVLGGNLNVGSNALTTSGHLVTLPTNTGTVLLTNGSGSSLSGIVTSITGTANNLTSSASTGAVTLNLGSNVVTTGGSAQTISKAIKITGLSTAETGNKTSSYTVTSSDDVVYVNDTLGSVTITLPTAVGLDGKIFTIKKVSSSLNTVTIATTGGQTIDGATNVVLNNAQEKAIVQSNNHYWFTLSNKGDDMDSYRIRGSTASRYFSSGIDQYADVIGGTPTATTLNAYPFIVSKTIKIDQIGLSVSTLVAGSSCHAGIYTDSGNTAPSTLVTGSDVTLTTTSTGLKTGAVSITLQGNNLYWLAYECSTAATLKLVTIPVTSVPNVLGIVPTGAAVSVGTGYSATNTFGALPSTYPSAGLTVLTTAPVEIVVRIAS